ncbi:MAG: CARDB domain-containing protein [Peptococcia bacterium]
MVKRVFWLGVLTFLFFSLPVWAQEVPEEVFLGERIDVGCFNIWLHADGRTWQNTDGQPGPEEPYAGTDLDNDPQKEKYLRYVTFQAEPNQEWEKSYENIRAEASVDWFKTFTKEDYEVAGGAGKASKDGQEYVSLEYDLFFPQVWERRPHSYQLAPEISPLTVKFYLHDKRQAEDVKQEDQLELVEGWRWYLPVHLKFYGVPKPLVIDLEAVEIRQTSPVQTNTEQIATAVLRNNGDCSEQFTAQYFADGKKIGSEVLTLEAGESCTRNFNWQAPAQAGKCTLKIEVVPVEGEVNISNNIKTASIMVEEPNFIAPQCDFMNIDENEWSETYHWQEKRNCSYTDDNGVYHPATCTSSKEKTVTYQEKLTVDFSINTKQGDPNGGRESRGYWEIYPDTQNREPKYNSQRKISIHRQDPNKVTRSGYGYDLTVKTTYWTDWETKVPSKAKAKGGRFSGPQLVVVQFQDRNEIEKLVPVKTETKGKSVLTTWKLPKTSHTFPDGETIWETKHYTDVSLPDGEYLVRAIVSPCGQGIGEICQDDYVFIYGSVYDDIYTRPAKESEW